MAAEFVKFVLSRDGQAVIPQIGQAVPVPAREAEKELKDANMQ
jgi:ABC-type thiamine transport system substrate-binding protein